jgi:hypothetical protein
MSRHNVNASELASRTSGACAGGSQRELRAMPAHLPDARKEDGQANRLPLHDGFADEVR